MSKRTLKGFTDLCKEGDSSVRTNEESSSLKIALEVTYSIESLSEDAVQGLINFIHYARHHPEEALRLLSSEKVSTSTMHGEN